MTCELEQGNQMVTPEQLRNVAHRQGAGERVAGLHVGEAGWEASGVGVRGQSRCVQGGGRRFWTADDDATVIRLYPNTPTEDIAAMIGRTPRAVYMRADLHGLKKSAAYLASPAARRWDGKRGGATRFKAGHESWNKGAHWDAGGRSAETRFKPGQMPSNHKPIGYERVNADGYRERKIAEPKTFRAVHVLLWEEHLGPVPRGFAVTFKNRDKTDMRIDNLALVSRAALMRLNSYHNRYPKEIARLIQLRGALNRQINKREKQA